jgi:hypothetical protein
VCLDFWVLQTAFYFYHQQYGRIGYHGDIHDKLRHTAYRQLTCWCWQYLGWKIEWYCYHALFVKLDRQSQLKMQLMLDLNFDAD